MFGRYGVAALAAVLAFSVAPGCDEVTDTDIDPTVTSSWLPLVDGAQWRYVYEVEEVDGDPISARVLELSASGTEQREGHEYLRIGESGGSPDLYRASADSLVYEWPRDMPFEFPIMDASAQPAATLPIDIEYVEGSDTLWVSGELKYVRTEDVALSFATISGCRLFELRGAFAATSEPDLDLEFVTKAWFGQGIGYVKKVHEVYDGGTLQETRTRTLLYYSIPGGETDGDDGLYEVTGRVLEYSGVGIGGLEVKLEFSETESVVATTAADGSYGFTDVPSGDYGVSFVQIPDGYWGVTLRADFVVAGSDTQAPDLMLMLMSDPNGFSVGGMLSTAAGLPIEGARVRMVRGPGTLDWTSGVEGDWYGYNVPDGTYTISAHLDDFTFAPDSVVVNLSEAYPSGALSSLDFVGSGGATVTGRVVTPIDLPLPDVTVGLGNPFGTPQVFATTDADGVYAFTDIPPASYWVWGADPIYMYTYSTGEPWGDSLTVTGTSASVSDMVATPASSQHTLSGTIRNSRGMGPWGDDNSAIGIYNTLFGIDYSTFIDTGQGTFSVEVPDGPYIVTPTLTVYPAPSPDTVSITVSGSSVSDITFTFTGYTLSGRVVDGSGTGIGGVTVNIDGMGMNPDNTTTGADGRFSFADLVLGNYNVGVLKDGYTFTPSLTATTVNGNVDMGTFTGTPVPSDG